MTNEEQKAIEDIQGTAGFRVIKASVEAKLKKVESVMGIDKNALVAEQALSRQLTYEVLREFLNELGLITPLEKELRRTYE